MLQLLLSLLMCAATSAPQPRDYFAIQVIDDQTSRGVPLAELETVDHQRFCTDSAGYIAFNEPGLMNQKIFFFVSSFGYEFPKDFFGVRGTVLETKPGGSATLKLKRVNVAERLYRVTGRGIYSDSVLLGKKPPIEQPLLNAQVLGQDSNIAELYRGKIYWFWGDTSKLSYPLGNFATTAATSELPGKGGLAPSAGVNLHYFIEPKEGFTKKIAPVEGAGPVWIDGVCVLKDDAGKERMLCHYSRMKDLGTRLERGLMVYNDQAEQFDKLKQIDLDAPLSPVGHSLQVKNDDGEWIYFCSPYPCVRVGADWNAATDVSGYEGYTCLADGTRYDGEKTRIDRDAAGKPIFRWRKGTAPLNHEQQKELIKSGALKRDDLPCRFEDVESHKSVEMHGGSVYWNEFRKRYISIFVQGGGDSFLGEVWYSEADKPEGPWLHARKVATHVKEVGFDNKQTEKQDLYNPVQHPFFDEDGGRVIYFEGTYSNTFSGTPTPTPKYEYNQLMYRLDLSDPRLKLP